MNEYQINIGDINDMFTYLRRAKGEDVDRFPFNIELDPGINFPTQIDTYLNRYSNMFQEQCLKEDLAILIRSGAIPSSLRKKDNYVAESDAYIVRNFENFRLIRRPGSSLSVYSLEELGAEAPELYDENVHSISNPSFTRVAYPLNMGHCIDITFGTYVFRGRDITFISTSTKDSYSIKALEKSIQDISREIENDIKVLDQKKQRLDSFKWIHSFMVENKIDREEKTTLQTKLILNIMKENSDEEEIATNVSEVLNLQI